MMFNLRDAGFFLNIDIAIGQPPGIRVFPQDVEEVHNRESILKTYQ